MATYTCEQCGATFHRSPAQVARSKHLFCSKTCLGAWKTKRTTVACAYCGTTVERAPWQLTYQQTFCSVGCSDRWKREHGPRGESHPNYRSQTVVCANCGTPIKRQPKFLARFDRSFCGYVCHAEWNAKTGALQGTNNPRYNSVSVSCAHCGQALKRPAYRVQNNNKQFCDDRCKGAWLSQHNTGTSHPLWKGGRNEYYGPNWLRQRRAARKRDDYTCQRCGRRERLFGRQLDVHHIRPFRDFGYTLGVNDAYKQANELYNLISLCVACHKIVEHHGL